MGSPLYRLEFYSTFSQIFMVALVGKKSLYEVKAEAGIEGLRYHDTSMELAWQAHEYLICRKSRKLLFKNPTASSIKIQLLLTATLIELSKPGRVTPGLHLNC